VKPWYWTILAFLLLFAPGTPAQAAPGGVAWRGWDAGLKEARRLKRPILVNVHTQWCGWCKRMDRDVYALPEVREYLSRKFVTITLDAEDDAPARYQGRTFTSRSLSSWFRVTGYPTTLFLRANGEHLVDVPGYVPAEKFLLVLQYIGDGHMDRGEPWEDFSARAQR
jgi:thioredoxin-related protein